MEIDKCFQVLLSCIDICIRGASFSRMGVVDRKKTSHISGDAIFGNMPIEGTSARTRPFSFEEVMLRRKNKEVVADAKEGAFEPREHYEKNIGGGFNRTDDVHKLVMDMKDKGKEGSRKTEEITSKKGEHHSKGRYKDKNDLDTDTEVKHRHHKSSGEKQSKNDTKNRHRSRTDDRAKAEFEKESRKKRSKDVMTKDKDMEKDRDYERKPKRIHHTVSDAKFRSELDRSNFKTVQSKLQEFEYSERGRRHEASKSKSRRSRSRERYHKREKSISLSPRLHKRSYHEESSSHFRGRLGRQYSDTDKYRTSWSGGYDNRHYQHRGSGLGGYSPRKRRINNTSKSPSPMTGSPEKKATTWDQPPAGSLPASILSASTNADNFPSHHIMQNVSKILPAPSANTTETVSNTSADSIQLTQATRPMRRLYIENLPPSASDKTMTEWLNGVLYSSGSQPQGTPCISCIVSD